ncbi:MAG TPA: PASTA domain-containing protein [Terracidiphilus sp.]|nr:PASTA domain-containing protein [Terracidiphilus sp.]
MSTQSIKNFFQVASLLLLLVAVGLMAAVITMQFAIHGAEVQVPALKGMTVADARSETSGLGLNLDVDNRYYSSDVAAGHILTQSPDPGTIVRREWRVRVSESLGPQKVDVPDTVGSAERVADLELRRAGLELGVTARLPFAGAPEGAVLAQDPPAHAQDIAQPTVNLLVAAPGANTPDGYVMPDMTGRPAIGAQAELTRVGIKNAPLKFVDVGVPDVGSGSAPPKVPIMPGSVIAQTPAAGSRIDQDTTVTLTVAR